jgi:hypothetical protein
MSISLQSMKVLSRIACSVFLTFISFDVALAQNSFTVDHGNYTKKCQKERSSVPWLGSLRRKSSGSL